MTAAYHGLRFEMQTVRGVPEFDLLSHQSQLLFSALEKMSGSSRKIGHALAFNPGQGHVPVALWKRLAPNRVTLVDRDLLSLRAAERNLRANGCADQMAGNIHLAGLPQNKERTFDLILGILRDGEGPKLNYALMQQAATLLSAQGDLLVAASSTTIARLEKQIKQDKLLTVRQRRRNRAKRMLILRFR
jgi:16S rRNA G1207 methylase RsmC